MKLKTQIYLNNLHAVMWIRMNYFTNPDPEFFSIRSKSGSGNPPYGSKGKKSNLNFSPKIQLFKPEFVLNKIYLSLYINKRKKMKEITNIKRKL